MSRINQGTDGRRALVIGAGIVGTCSALYLQRQGFSVTMIDRQEPGEGCSSGNAGNLGNGSCVPASLPGMLPKVPGMLLDPLHPLSIRLAHLPAAVPWLIRFARAGKRRRVEEIADALHSLQSRLFDAYEPLVAAAGAAGLIRRNGKLFVYESRAAFEGDAFGADLRRRRGIELEVLEGDAVRRLEPALGVGVACARFQPDTGHTVDPLQLIRALAESFVAGHGTLLVRNVQRFHVDGGAVTGVLTDAGRHDADLVVLAAGVWSKSLAAQLGCRVPLESEGGYHVMLPEPRVSLRIPILACERKINLTSMEGGLRITGIAEFAGIDAPPDYGRADVLLHHARQLLPSLNAEGATRWRGQRPSTPDSLPVIGPAPGHANVLFAFGHGRLGLGLGAITGKLIAQLAAGQVTDVDLAPFRADRF